MKFQTQQLQGTAAILIIYMIFCSGSLGLLRDNFKEKIFINVIGKENIIAAVPDLNIILAPRVRLLLQLNTAPRLPTKADGPSQFNTTKVDGISQININIPKIVTSRNDTSLNKNKTTSGNMVSQGNI